MRISDWSSDVCSSDLIDRPRRLPHRQHDLRQGDARRHRGARLGIVDAGRSARRFFVFPDELGDRARGAVGGQGTRSEEHTSELQSLMRISYAVFCLKKKKTTMQVMY